MSSSSSAAYGLRRAKYVTIEELILSHYDIDQERLGLELAELKQKHPTTTTIAVNTPSDFNLTEDTVVADVIEQEVECNTVSSNTNVHNTAAVKPNAWTVPNSNVRPIAASPSAADSTTTIKQPQLFPIPSTTTTSRPYHPSRLQPPRDGFNLCLLVHKVDIVVNKYRVDGSHVLVAEVTVGDESGSISVRARDEQIDLFRQVLVSSSTSNNSSNKKGGTAVVLRNCTMELYLGKYLRLGVSKWGKISIYPDGIPSTPSPPSRINQEVNYSDIDLNLVASPKKIVSAIVDHDGNDDNNGRPSYFPAMVQAPSQVVRHHHQQQQQQQNQNNRHYCPPMKHHQQYQRQQNQRQLPEHTTNFGGKKSSTSGGRCQQQQQRQQKQQNFFPHHNIHQSRGFSSSSGNSSRQIYHQQQASSQQMLQHYQQQHQHHHQQLQRQYSDTSSVYSYHSGDGSQYQSQHHQQQQHHHQQQQQQHPQLIPNEHYNHQQYIYQQYQDMQYRHSQQMVLLQQEQETQLHFLNQQQQQQQQQGDSNSSSVGGGVYSTVFRGGEEDIAAFLAPPQAEEEYTTLTHSSPLSSPLSSQYHHHHHYHQNTNITASAYVTISPLPSMILEDSPQQQQRQLPLLYDDSTVAPAEAPN